MADTTANTSDAGNRNVTTLKLHHHTYAKPVVPDVTSLQKAIDALTSRVAALEAAVSNMLLRVVALEGHFNPPQPPPPPAATVPGAPTGLVATAGNTTVALRWTAPASNGGAAITGYRVYRGGTLIASPAGASLTDTGRTNGTTYTYTVTAVNSVGESAASGSASATPAAPPAPPPGFTTIQAAVNAATAGSTITIPDGTYRETVTVNKALTLVAQNRRNAVIDGRDASGNVARNFTIVVTANNVQLRGLVAQYGGVGGARQDTNVQIHAGVTNTVIDDCDLGWGGWGSLHMGESSATLVSNCDIHDGGALGVHLGGGASQSGGNKLQGNRIYHNARRGLSGVDAEDEAGGVKATDQNGLQYINNEVYDNYGPGLWNDIYCHDTLYEGNRCHDNTYSGIMEEVSYDAQIHANVCWRNGAGKVARDGHGWGWGAGILVSTSTGTEVWGNTCAWNAAAPICIVYQDRNDWPDVKPSKNINVHDNMSFAAYDLWLQAWDDDAGGSPLYSGSNNNHGANEAFYLLNAAKTGPAAEDGHSRWAWSSDFSSLTSWHSVPPGSNARYLTDAERISILTAAGVPLLP